MDDDVASNTNNLLFEDTIKPTYYKNFRELLDKTFNVENPPRMVVLT